METSPGGFVNLSVGLAVAVGESEDEGDASNVGVGGNVGLEEASLIAGLTVGVILKTLPDGLVDGSVVGLIAASAVPSPVWKVHGCPPLS